MPRARTTKGLAKRIELTYYQKPHPFRRWWRILCLVVPSLGALWLVGMAALGDQRIYTSGPVATAHTMIDAACERCHVEVTRPAAAAPGPPAGGGAASPVVATAGIPIHAGGWFLRRVSDGACLTCHDGSVHHDTQTVEPRCAACHLEHTGQATLAFLTDRHCTQCHADLKTKGGPSEFERRVPSLAQHPEFAVFRKNQKDQAAIKLSHETHLRPDLPAGGGKRVTLGCEACHRVDPVGRYMLPIAYRTHCADCHPLEASADIRVPHERPELIRGFLLARLASRSGASAAPGVQPPRATDPPTAPEAPSGRPRRPGTGAWLEGLVVQPVQYRGDAGPAEPVGPRPLLLAQRQRGGAAVETPAPAPAESPAPAGGRRRGGAEPPSAPTAPAEKDTPAPSGMSLAAVAQFEKELFTGRTGCKYCHTLEEGEGGLPKIVPPKIPNRWLAHSVFDHRAHRPLACVACHAAAPKSVETADVLLPKIGVCQECHRTGGGARSGCVECHVYHDRATERSADGPLSVGEFVTGRPSAAPPPPAKPSG